jgi:hypothetical protein
MTRRGYAMHLVCWCCKAVKAGAHSQAGHALSPPPPSSSGSLRTSPPTKINPRLPLTRRPACVCTHCSMQLSMQVQAADLVTASYGGNMLSAIGSVYATQADIYLGNFFEGGITALRAHGHTIKSQFAAAGMALKVYQAAQQISKLEVMEAQAKAAEELEQLEAKQAQQALEEQQQQEKEKVEVEGYKEVRDEQQSGAELPQASSRGGDTGAAPPPATAPEEASNPPAVAGSRQTKSSRKPAPTVAEVAAAKVALEEQTLPLMLDAMWSANLLDIENMLRRVCQRVLKDPAASKPLRKLRAEALREAGTIFMAAQRATEGTGTEQQGGVHGSSSGPAQAAGAAATGAKKGGRTSSGADSDPASRTKAAKQKMEDVMQQIMEKRLRESDERAA